jgi:hypothetical protein
VLYHLHVYHRVENPIRGIDIGISPEKRRQFAGVLRAFRLRAVAQLEEQAAGPEREVLRGWWS